MIFELFAAQAGFLLSVDTWTGPCLKPSEGYEVLRDLGGRTDEGWDGIRKVADTLREDILSLFDHIREWAREEVDYR